MTEEWPNSPCACLGPQGDDPVCPCQMRAKGLNPSSTWSEEDREKLNKALIEIFAENKRKNNGSQS